MKTQFLLCGALLAASGFLASCQAQGFVEADVPEITAPTQPVVVKELRVYHVGNSVTDTIRYDSLGKMASERGHTYTAGRQMIPGSPLSWLWQHPNDGFKNDKFGYPTQAFPGFEWDVITLQPFDRKIEGEDGDLKMARNFIDLALQNPANEDTQIYIYQRWPRRDQKKGADGKVESHSLDYAGKYNRKYTNGWNNTNETADFFNQLVEKLNADLKESKLQKPVLMVPVGDVLLELEKRAKAGEVPGLKSVEELYSDGIHFNNAGAFLVGTTFYSTLWKTDPTGLSSAPYAKGKPATDREITPELARAVQQTVWDVVSKHPLAGVAKN